MTIPSSHLYLVLEVLDDDLLPALHQPGVCPVDDLTLYNRGAIYVQLKIIISFVLQRMMIKQLPVRVVRVCTLSSAARGWPG